MVNLHSPTQPPLSPDKIGIFFFLHVQMSPYIQETCKTKCDSLKNRRWSLACPNFRFLYKQAPVKISKVNNKLIFSLLTRSSLIKALINCFYPYLKNNFKGRSIKLDMEVPHKVSFTLKIECPELPQQLMVNGYQTRSSRSGTM